MIVDCHTHISCRGYEIGPEDHFAESESVDACIVLASPGGDNQQVNRDLSDYVGKHPKKMFGFGVVNPVRDDISVKYISGLKDRLKLDGVVVYCCGDSFHPAHSRAMQFYETAEQLNLPVFFHNTGQFSPGANLDYARPFLIDEVARSFPGLKIIIGGMGKPFLSQTLCVLAKNQNVYADLTISPGRVWDVYNLVVSAHEADVMDKLLFGSGLPVGKPQSCIEALLGFNKLIANTDLPTVPREKIRGIIERDSLQLLGIDY